MATHRMIPPDGGATTKVNGRTYTCASGSTIDVPDFDAERLQGAGWLIAAGLGSGTTAQRPTNVGPQHAGQVFHDTTLQYNVMWNGKRWVNPFNGNAV